MPNQPLVAVTRRISEGGLKLLQKKGYRLKLNTKDRSLTRVELVSLVKGASAVLSLLTDHIDGGVFDAAGKQMKIVANYAVGFDNVDITEAKKRGIVVTNTPEVLSRAVAEHTIALMFACAKRIVEADAFTRSEKYKGWDPLLFLGVELSAKTLGIVGLGRIGKMVAEMAYRGMNMKILYHDVAPDHEFEKNMSAKFVSMEKLLRMSDVITLHVPLLPATRHLISTKEFAMMKTSAILINTSRGPVVDEKALERALKKKDIFAAALDVFECEPAIDCDVSDNLELKNLSNVIMTPHIASATFEARNEMSLMAAKNIIAVLSGKKPLTPVS